MVILLLACIGASSASAAPLAKAARRPASLPHFDVREHRGTGFQATEMRLPPHSPAQVLLLRNPSAHGPERDERPACGGYLGDPVSKLLENDPRPITAVVNGAIFSYRSQSRQFRPSLYAWSGHSTNDSEGAPTGVIQSFRLGPNGAARHITYLLWIGQGSQHRVAKIQVLPCAPRRGRESPRICVKALTPEFGNAANSIKSEAEFQASFENSVGNRGMALELNMPILSLERDRPVTIQGMWKTMQTQSTPRTVACLRRDGTTSFLITTSASVASVGNWILNTPDLDCRQAFNLDGGGSTQMWVRQADGWDLYREGGRTRVPLGDPARREVGRTRVRGQPDVILTCPLVRPVDFYIALTNS